MGTAALEDPGLVATISERQPVALGLDVRGREVAVRGWAEGSGVDWSEALRRLADAGAEAVVVTQIDVEGLMGGADAGGLAEVLAATDLDVIASGGVGSLADQLGRASWRERVCQYGLLTVVAGSLKKKTSQHQKRIL